jgi:hypothetical protein
MKTIFNLALVGIILLAGCNKSGVAPAATNSKASMNLNTKNNLSSTNGSAGITNIYYDGQLFMMNLKPFTDQPASTLLAHNQSINILYEADGFVTVTDAIQADGYNPVWQEVDIVFNNGVTPHQFLSDNDVLAAASGPNATITLVPTNEIYRCDILQHTKPQ